MDGNSHSVVLGQIATEGTMDHHDQHPPSDITLNDLLARELARHYSDGAEPKSVNEVLGDLADACWTRAEETPDPYEDETVARALIARALEFAARRSSEQQRDFMQARRVFQGVSFTMPGASKNSEQPRLRRTYRLMASCLWEAWVGHFTLWRVPAD